MNSRPGHRTPGWEAQPGPAVTSTPAEPGEVRADANGTQWHLTPGGWQPVIIPAAARPGPPRPAPQPEPEAG